MGRPSTPPGTWGKVRITPGPLNEKGKPVSYTATAYFKDPVTGRTLPKRAKGRTATAAENRLKDRLANEKPPTGTPGTLMSSSRVAALAEMWLEQRELEKSLAGNAGSETMAVYRYQVSSNILPTLGAFHVSELDAQHVDGFLTTLAKRSPAQARLSKVCLSGMVKLAVRYGALSADFMTSVLKLPRTGAKEANVLNQADIEVMLSAIDSYRTGPHVKGPRPDGRLGRAFRIQLGTGLRIGEVLALRRCDVVHGADDVPWRLTIEGTIIESRETGQARRQSWPKTSSSVREIPVTDFAADALDELLQKIADDPSPDALLFRNRNGGVVRPSEIRKAWNRIRPSIDMNGVVPHKLRRTMATFLHDTISPEFAALFIGHGHDTRTLFAHYVPRRTNVDPTGAMGSVLNGLAKPNDI